MTFFQLYKQTWSADIRSWHSPTIAKNDDFQQSSTHVAIAAEWLVPIQAQHGRTAGHRFIAELSTRMEAFLPTLVAGARLAGLLTPHCEHMLAEGHYFDSLCIKQFSSRALNIGIIAGSLFLQLPQIIKILVSKSVVGLSELTFVLQVFLSMPS